MKYRNIIKEIEPFIDSKQIIAVCGLRRTGKTTLIKHLLEKSPGENKKYFDLERAEFRFLFSSSNYENIAKSLEFEGLDLSVKAFVAIDEIQLVPGITSIMKYLYDTYDIKFFVTGSSSFYMKNQFSESLAGRKFLFELHTLSFDEFLNFKSATVKPEAFNFQSANPYIIDRLGVYYEEYIQYGGFPEIALTSDVAVKKKYLSDIINSYLNLDIKYLSDFTTTDEIYKLLRLLSARTGSKTDFSKLSGISGINRKKIKDYLSFLENTFFIKQISPFVINTDREIALQKKIYFSDNGLLNILGKVSSGALFENMVANQLSRLGKLNYYARRSGQEIDFILDNKYAFEVKETPTVNDLRILTRRAASLKLKEIYLTGKNYPPTGFTDFIWGGSIF